MNAAQLYDLRQELLNWKSAIENGRLDDVLTDYDKVSYRMDLGLMYCAIRGATPDETAARARTLVAELAEKCSVVRG